MGRVRAKFLDSNVVPGLTQERVLLGKIRTCWSEHGEHSTDSGAPPPQSDPVWELFSFLRILFLVGVSCG